MIKIILIKVRFDRCIQIFQKKTSNSASLTMLKPLTVWITKNCEKFLKR